MLMDEKLNQVLDTYHVMIRREREQMVPGDNPDHKLLAVGPDTGQLINILARSLKKPIILELGTSFGYSGIWLAAAARASGGRVITMEKQIHKSEFARDMAAKAGLADYIDFRVGDAVQLIDELDPGIDFVLLDLWKDLYVPCLDAFYPKLSPGAIIVADNMIMPRNDHIQRYGQTVRAKPGISSVLLPVGHGIEVSRFDPH